MVWSAPVTWTGGQLVGATDLNTQLRDNMLMLGGTTGYLNNVGVGTAPLLGIGIVHLGTLNAVSGNAQGFGCGATLVAQANNDLLYGVLVQSTYNINAKTGVTSYAGRFVGPTGAGVNNYGIYIDAPTGASGSNIGVYVAGGGITVANGGVQFAGAAPTVAGGSVGLGGGIPSLGGGAAPTLGTIGGSGPASAAQVAWWQINVGGVARFIPIWA